MAIFHPPNWWRFWTLLHRFPEKKCPKKNWLVGFISIYIQQICFFVIYKYIYVIDLTFCIEISKVVWKQTSQGIVKILVQALQMFRFSSWLEVLGLPYQRRWWFWFWSWLYISQCILSTGCGETLGFLSGQWFSGIFWPKGGGDVKLALPKTNRNCPWTWTEKGRIVFQPSIFGSELLRVGISWQMGFVQWLVLGKDI